ncbi:IS481 family transposase [Streptomyces sp. CB02959]|uniref:IS481 family transposase n=2 Tax=unclassified Streptomyces TaxID=2593676 RepID=UPI0015E0AF7E|nr:IS481 family transposase [Streptomyces sp. CB02959]
MPHRNAPLTETGRLRLARCVVEDGWPLRRAAERFQVSPTTAQRWAGRYRTHGEAGMRDLSSCPHTSPRRTPTRTERRIIKVRVLRRWGPARIAHLLHLVPSTVHRVLTRYGLARLAHLDRATGRVIRRYERDRPGELVHVDIKKLGNIPDGGGHKVLGRAAGRKTRSGTGYSYLHTAVDDHSRLAYSEIHTDEKKETATGFWKRAHAFFAQAGITVERVLTDNGSCYRSRNWRDALADAGITHKRTRPYRVAGPIAFLGLLAPYAARALAGARTTAQLALSGLIAADVMIVADVLARIVIRPWETPVSVLLAFVGGPLLVWIARSSRLSTAGASA